MSQLLTDTVVLFAEKWHTTPFDVLEKDIDDFILIANNLIENQAEKTETQKKQAAKKNDGFWDM